MTQKPPYRKNVSYNFDCGGENWDIYDWSDSHVGMEETRKNGQEDGHISADFVKVDGKWILDDDDPKWVPQIVSYLGRSVVDDIINYLTEHGPPPPTE